MNKMNVLSVLFSFLVIVTVFGSIQGQEQTTAVTSDDFVLSSDTTAPPTDQIIIKFSGNVAENSLLAADVNGQLPALSAVAGVELTYFRPMSGEAHVLLLPNLMPVKEVELIAADLMAAPGVEYAEPDRVKTIDVNPGKRVLLPSLTPNDSLWNQMWHLGYTANTAEGLNLVPAWDISTGSASTVVAVIDTGILNHTDLAGKTVPGYDFISDVSMANDGNGRDSNPADPGDWVAANECYSGSSQGNSSWHGTHVAGTIGAASNNNQGITGINWNAKILPLRVLGKCGGMTSDIVDAMRWAAGLSVTGIPNNANPADVLNLSLGGYGSCSTSEQNAIDAVVATGATFVIAAGNANANAVDYSPGNCNNIITVAATDRSGDRAYYSNYGSIIEVSAPGGAQSFANDPNGVLSTLDSGTTTPNNDNAYVFYQGTSMAAPHVAGLASLIKGMRPGYTQAQVLSLLQSTARSFPAGSSCNTSNCGTGIIDAYQALRILDITFTDFIYLPIVIKAEPPAPVCTPQSGESDNINDALTTCSGHIATGQVSDVDIDDVYKIQMEANQYLTINMTGSGGDADLYLYPPGTTDVNTDPFAASSTAIGNNEYISGQTLTGGYWYIDVYSYDGTTNYNVTATVTTVMTGEVTVFSLTPENLYSSLRQSKP